MYICPAMLYTERALLCCAGRKRVEDGVDFAAGVLINAKVGATVGAGDSLCTLYTSQPLTEKEQASAVAMAFQAFDLEAPAAVEGEGVGGAGGQRRLIKYFVDKDGVYDYDYAADGH